MTDFDDFRTEFQPELDALQTPPLDRWQDPENEGFPTDAYFTAVEKALAAAGITGQGWRDEDWEYSIELDEAFTGDYARLYISWRVDEDSEPLKGEWLPTSGGMLGWFWVPYSDDQKACGDFARSFNLPVLEEPEQVAAAVAELVKGDTK